MSDVRVTIGANSAPLQSEFEKVKRSAQGLKHSIGETGGILEGDRRVENKMTAWVEGFKNAQNGADLLANTMGNLGDVFKTSLAVGVGLNVGAAIVGMLGSAMAKADELRQSAKDAGDELRKAFASGDSGQLESAIKRANEQITKLKKSVDDTFGGGGVKQIADIVNLQKDKKDAAGQLLEIAKAELEIQRLINDGELDKADILKEQLLTKKEIARIDELGLAKEDRNPLVGAVIDASEERLEKKREERRQAAIKKDEAAYEKVREAKQEAEGHFIEYQDWLADEARKNKEKSEQETAKSIASFYVQKEKDKWQAILDIAAEAGKKIAAAEKAAEERKQEAIKAEIENKKDLLKQENDILKKGAQEQRQRDNDKVQGILGGESLVMQRANARVKDAAYNKAAGIAARDEVRRKLDGDAVKMESKKAKDEIEAVKKRMLGEKPLSEKEIAAAAKAIPEMQKDIAKLVAKLGVK